jgi:glycine/D-amino acid oxidase-like deaminating enzyme
MTKIEWTGEAEQGYPYWWDALTDAPSDDGLPERCDLLVIGAGFTGLSAAIAAHDCGAKVVVVDAGEPGKGASTRNGGMFGAHPRLSWEELSAQYGAEVADDLMAESVPALKWAKGLIEAEGIDCDLQQVGRIQLAWTKPHFENVKRMVRNVSEKSEVKIRLVEREDLAAEINTERYFGGAVFDEHCGIHPAKFHQGLMRAARRRGIPVVGHAAVTRLEREGTGFSARTAKGDIRADKVVLATNGYTSKPFDWYARRVFALPSFILATQALDPNLIGHLAPGRRMMVETRARHSYFRISPDGTRILFGGRAAMVDLDLGKAAERQRQSMLEVWPELREVKFSHIWTGNTGYSFKHMPNVGEDRGLHHAMGFSGSGTVMAPYLGAKAAYQAMGDERGQTAFSQTSFKGYWAHPFSKPHFLKVADIWYRNFVDHKESWQSR